MTANEDDELTANEVTNAIPGENSLKPTAFIDLARNTYCVFSFKDRIVYSWSHDEP